MRFFAVFAVIAIAEMATFFWVESKIGLGWALGLALTTALIGSYLVKRAGVTVWRAIRTKADSGLIPGKELTHGAAILVSGAFLISPGFITDALGFLLLIPAVRDVIHSIVVKRLGDRIQLVSNFRSKSSADVVDVDSWDTE